MTDKPIAKGKLKNGKTHPWRWVAPTTAQHKELLQKGDRAVPLPAMMGIRK